MHTYITQFRKLIQSRSRFMNKNPKYSKYLIGDWTYGFPNIIEGLDPGTLRMGKFCSIASDVSFYLINDHQIKWVSTYPFPRLFLSAQFVPDWPKIRGDIVIENDVWIGIGAKILSGITVGNGAIIGAHAVVTKSVPPYAIVGGNPASIIKYRFSEKQITQLQKIAWWDWPISKIENAFPDMLTDNIDGFINKHI